MPVPVSRYLDVLADTDLVHRRFGERTDSPNVLFLKADVTDRSSLVAATAKITSHWEAPYGLINNAALDSVPNAPLEENGPFETYPEIAWDRMMEVNVKGAFQCCQIIGGAMAQAGRGSIINISSMYGMISPKPGLYKYPRARRRIFQAHHLLGQQVRLIEPHGVILERTGHPKTFGSTL